MKVNGKQSKTRSDFGEVVKKKACKRACLQAFWRRVRDSNPRFLVGTRHFECRTFDLSDNSPRVYFNLFFQPIKIHSKNFWEEKQERKLKIIRFSSLKTPIKSRFFYGRNCQTVLNFRVSPVMTTSIRLHMYLQCATIIILIFGANVKDKYYFFLIKGVALQ